jgi:soluble lytic murein transglycosylase-like protein
MPRFQLFLIPLAMAARAWTADPPQPVDPKQAMEASLARQREAAGAMEASVARQRESVRKQTPQAPPGSFFLLDAPGGGGGSAAPQIEAPPAECEPLPVSAVEVLISDTARRQEIEPDLLRGVVRQESSFRPCAVSSKGAMGLMQLMPATAASLGVKNPFDPRENLDAGARFLKQLLTQYDSLALALGAYNAGPGKVDRAEGIPKIPETLNYVQKILSGLPITW